MVVCERRCASTPKSRYDERKGDVFRKSTIFLAKVRVKSNKQDEMRIEMKIKCGAT